MRPKRAAGRRDGAAVPENPVSGPGPPRRTSSGHQNQNPEDPGRLNHALHSHINAPKTTIKWSWQFNPYN